MPVSWLISGSIKHRLYRGFLINWRYNFSFLLLEQAINLFKCLSLVHKQICFLTAVAKVSNCMLRSLFRIHRCDLANLTVLLCKLSKSIGRFSDFNAISCQYRYQNLVLGHIFFFFYKLYNTKNERNPVILSKQILQFFGSQGVKAAVFICF